VLLRAQTRVTRPEQLRKPSLTGVEVFCQEMQLPPYAARLLVEESYFILCIVAFVHMARFESIIPDLISRVEGASCAVVGGWVLILITIRFVF
jgi:hypothetical protein